MSKYGKWLGGGLGWALGGPIGAIMGFLAGSMFDNMSDGVQVAAKSTSRGDFGASLLILSAAVMKADGKVLKSELDYVKSFFIKQVGQAETQQRMLMLKEIINQEFSLQDVCTQIRYNMQLPLRLQLMHYLFGISMADGQIHLSEIEIIRKIAEYLGISQMDFESVKAMFVKDTTSAYRILEITPDATDEELKKAYRRMALKYHPDKVGHLGDDIQKAANEKFQKLNAAYELIKNERKII
ncbi:MAG: DnaJ domain-containing protein [Bacteroidetes bacterium]|nr:DnaJ domain-containing protein [Bacteroidota bacterium]